MVVFTILLYLFRTTIPFLKFPFIFLFFGFIIYSITYERRQIINVFKRFLWDFYLSIILAIILIVAFLLSNKIYLASFKDIINAIILIILLFLSMAYVTSKIDLIKFYKSFLRGTVLFAVLISVRLLFDYFNIQSYSGVISSDTPDLNSMVESLSTDFNFALLPIFFGMFGIFYFLNEPISFLKKIGYNLILVVYSATILFSGSRRGLIAFTCIIIFLIIIQFLTLFSKNDNLIKLQISSKWFIISNVSLSFIFIGFIFFVPVQLKRIALKQLGIPVRSYKQILSIRLYRYSRIFSNYLYSDFMYQLWPVEPIPEYPDTGWDERIGTYIFPLSGENVEIVPQNSIGYKMDKTCDGVSWNNNAYSFTNISSLYKIDSKKSSIGLFESSVYCFVSKDFDGTWVAISDKDGPYGKIVQKYDFDKKGIWQKLQITFDSKSEIIPIYLYWSKFGVSDFSSLKGYVIFAFPEYRKVISRDSILSFTDYQIETRQGINHNTTDDKVVCFPAGVLKLVVKQNSNLTSYNIHNECSDMFQQRNEDNFSNTWYAGVFPTETLNLHNFFSTVKDRDPIQSWVANLISEDTTYHAFKSLLSIDTVANSFLGERLMRWQFAWQIFKKEYNFKQKVFGGGFNFLNWYGFYFLKDKTITDYPHNPFLSVLLYSGIVGLILYFVFFFYVFLYYLESLKRYFLFFIFFLITFFFSFFSAGGPFDPPIMGFFMLLPFFLHSIQKNKIQPIYEKLTNDKDINHREK